MNSKKEYSWDLTSLLNNKTINHYYEEIGSLVNKINDYKSSYYLNLSNFKKFNKLSNDLSYIIQKIYCYLYNTQSEDVSNSSNTKELLKFQAFTSSQNEKLCWIRNSIIKNDSKINKLINKNKELEYLKRNYEKIFKYKSHIIPDNQEKLLSNFSVLFDSSSTIFNTLTSSDMDFGVVKNSTGKEFKLNQNNYSTLIKDKDSILRKNVYNAYWLQYYKFRNTLSLNYFYNVYLANADAKVYKFKSCLDEALFSDDLTGKFYDNLLKQTKKYTHLTKKWFLTITKIIKIKDPYPWDLSQPLFKFSNKKFTIKQAHEIIYDSLVILGKDYKSKIKYIFENKCISYLPTKNKRQGAYSYGVWKNKPYISMNWNSQYQDLTTLIHETGHSIHSLYSDSQPYIYHDYPIFLAEIASITNEVLLNKHLLIKYKNNNEFKKMIIENAINTFVASVFRQIQFADFEKWAHSYIEKNRSCSSDDIIKKCKELNKIYYPKPSNIKNYKTEYSGLWGIYVPHFYRDYYVYKYATSMIIAIAIASKLEQDDTYYKKYTWFLSQGNFYKPLDLLKEIGIDLEKDASIYSKAFGYLENLIDKLNKLI